MKSIFQNTLVRPVASIALTVAALIGGGAVQAAETASGTPITNLATLNYAIGGTSQPAIGSSPAGNSTGGGAVTTFTVDNKVNLSVTAVDTAVVSVSPGSIGRVTTFTVTNLGNAPQGYTLVGANTTGQSIGGTADTIDVSPLAVYIENGTTNSYQVGQDIATSIPTLLPGESRTVYIVANIPAGAANGAQANVSLTATTTDAGTTDAAIQSAANTAGVDIVFADAATTELEFVGSSAARDARGTARSAYRIASAVLTFTKTVVPLCDPFNGLNNPKNIPGSFVRYTMTVLNAGPTSVSLTTIADPLSTLVTFDPNLITGAGTVPASCTSGTGTPTVAPGTGFQITLTSPAGATRAGFPKSFTTTSTADGVDLVGTTVTADFGLILPVEGNYAIRELKSGEFLTLVFNAQVN